MEKDEAIEILEIMINNYSFLPAKNTLKKMLKALSQRDLKLCKDESLMNFLNKNKDNSLLKIDDVVELVGLAYFAGQSSILKSLK